MKFDAIESDPNRSAQIVRDVVREMIATLSESQLLGVLLVASGEFGKSCVLAQCPTHLARSGTPYLCLRIDSFHPCHVAQGEAQARS